jgi:hypothetical protein
MPIGYNRRVKCRRELLLAILVYVALDLSLPAMPGAFVFEAADSVESIGGGRVATRVVALPAAHASSAQPSPELHGDRPRRLPAGCEVLPLRRPAAQCLPRGAETPSPSSSEDPD